MPRIFQNVEDCLSMQGHQPADLKLICRNALLGKYLARLFDYSFCRPPTDQGHLGIQAARQLRRSNCSRNTHYFAHALFHHGTALGWIREFVTDQDTVFIVFVASCSVGVAANAWNSAGRDT